MNVSACIHHQNPNCYVRNYDLLAAFPNSISDKLASKWGAQYEAWGNYQDYQTCLLWLESIYLLHHRYIHRRPKYRNKRSHNAATHSEHHCLVLEQEPERYLNHWLYLGLYLFNHTYSILLLSSFIQIHQLPCFEQPTVNQWLNYCVTKGQDEE